MPIRVLNDDGQAHEYEVAMAVNHAISQGADVINPSLVIPNHSSLLQNTLENAAHAGILVIAAAGNEGFQTIYYPAGDNCAVAVTAIDEESYSLPSPITAAGSIWRRRARRSTVPSRSRLFLERSARTTTARLGAAVLWPRP